MMAKPGPSAIDEGQLWYFVGAQMIEDDRMLLSVVPRDIMSCLRRAKPDYEWMGRSAVLVTVVSRRSSCGCVVCASVAVLAHSRRATYVRRACRTKFQHFRNQIQLTDSAAGAGAGHVTSPLSLSSLNVRRDQVSHMHRMHLKQPQACKRGTSWKGNSQMHGEAEQSK